jgi:hypothetical protein
MGQTITTNGEPTRLDEAAGGTGCSTRTVARLAELAIPSARSLADSFDERRKLFSHQLYEGVWSEIDSIYPHETLTSSCIALIGLARSDALGASMVEPRHCLDAIVGEVRRTDYLGGLGLVLWANAVADGDAAMDVLMRLGLGLDELLDELVPTFTTMETAWCASGLLHEAQRSGDPTTISAAQRVVDELRTSRFDPGTSLMRHAGPGAPTLHRARGHIANFADQIYSVQAFAFASIVLDDAEALTAGTRLGARHAELQGDLGQWWWHYDAGRGHVALRYAVYSVHQHGMAPMAYLALDHASGLDHATSIDASVAWIDDNESGASMVDTARSTIWRSLERVEPALAGRVRGGLEALGVEDRRDARVRLNRETRPYEWAWCMYAAAIAAGRPKGASIV